MSGSVLGRLGAEYVSIGDLSFGKIPFIQWDTGEFFIQGWPSHHVVHEGLADGSV